MTQRLVVVVVETEGCVTLLPPPPWQVWTHMDLQPSRQTLQHLQNDKSQHPTILDPLPFVPKDKQYQTTYQNVLFNNFVFPIKRFTMVFKFVARTKSSLGPLLFVPKH